MPFRTAIATIRVRFGCLLFRTVARLSGPRYLQLEYVLGACFSGPLRVFPDRNVYNKSTFWVLAFPDRCRSFRTTMATIRVRFGCLLFRTAAGLSGPQWLQLEYVLGACFSGPLLTFPDRNVYNKSAFWVLAFPDRCMPFRTAIATIRVRFGCLLFRTVARLSGPHVFQVQSVLSPFFWMS